MRRSYELEVDLPPGWRQFDPSSLTDGDGSDSPTDILRQLVREGGVEPDLAASAVWSVGEVTPGVHLLLSVAMAIKVQLVNGDVAPDDRGLVEAGVVESYPVADGVNAPVFLAVFAVPADDGHALAVATFSSPNIQYQDELLDAFGSIVASTRLIKVAGSELVEAHR